MLTGTHILLYLHINIINAKYREKRMLIVSPALEGKVRSGEKKAEALAKEKMRVEAELESMTKKSHDASGQLVHISQELLKKERYEDD